MLLSKTLAPEAPSGHRRRTSRSRLCRRSELPREKIGYTPLGVVDRPPGYVAADEADVAATRHELDLERGVVSGDRTDLVEDLGREKRIVDGAEQECRRADARQIMNGARLCVVITRVTEAV